MLFHLKPCRENRRLIFKIPLAAFASLHLLPLHIQRCTHSTGERTSVCVNTSVNVGTSLRTASWETEQRQQQDLAEMPAFPYLETLAFLSASPHKVGTTTVSYFTGGKPHALSLTPPVPLGSGLLLGRV